MIIKEFFIVLSALFLGYFISGSLNIPIPSNVLGFLILLLALCTGLLKVKHVEKVSDFIIKHLSIFFVVPTVGIMVHFQLIYSQFMKILVPLMLSIVLGYLAAGKVTEMIINHSDKKKSKLEQRKNGGELND